MESPSFNFFSRNVRPLFYWQGIPFYLTTLLAAVHVLCLFVGVSLTTHRWTTFAAFQLPSTLAEWHLWQFFTYPFVHVPEIYFVLDVLFLFFNGRMLEEHFGRKVFGILYGTLVFIPPATLLGAQALHLDNAFPFVVGTSLIHVCLFLGIAFLQPNAYWFFEWFKLKWAGLILFLLYTLQFLDHRDFVGLTAFCFNAGFTYWFLRQSGLTGRFGWLRHKLRLLPDPSPRRSAKGKQASGGDSPYKSKLRPRAHLPEEHRAVQEVDAVLEKIAKHGLGSLTEAERKLLEKASGDLRAKDE